MEQIVYNFRARLAKDENELGLPNLVDHKIDSSDNDPIQLPAYKTTQASLCGLASGARLGQNSTVKR